MMVAVDFLPVVPVLVGLVWFGLVWLGLAWLGLVWFGLVWFGLVGWLVGLLVSSR